MTLELSDYTLIFVISLVTFLILDGLWLGWVAKDVYKKQLRQKLRPDPIWWAAGLFYLLFLTGLMYFAIAPAIRKEALDIAMAAGGLYGFFTYMTYGLTNLATLKSWPSRLVFIDIVWGTVLSFVVSVVTYSLYIGIQG